MMHILLKTKSTPAKVRQNFLLCCLISSVNYAIWMSSICHTIDVTAYKAVLSLLNLSSGENHGESCLVDKYGFASVLNKINIPSNPTGPRILCFVNTHEDYHSTRVQGILDTWGPACDKLLFASSVTDESIGAVRIPNASFTYAGLWQKHRETLRYVYKNYASDFDWFFKADDDTYVIFENLKQFLGSPAVQNEHKKGRALHIGERVEMYISKEGIQDAGRTITDETLLAEYLSQSNNRFIFNVGGSGYVLNAPFLEKFMEWIDRRECLNSTELSTLLDDPSLSFCSANFDTYPSDLGRDEFGLERFHQERPDVLYTTQPGSDLYQSFWGGKHGVGGFQVGEDCCSKDSITFHHMDADHQREAHRLLYSCRHLKQRALLVPPGDALKQLGQTEWPPSASVFRIAQGHNRIIIMIVDCGVIEFADNLAASIEASGSTNFVFVPLDYTTFSVLLQAYPDNVVPPPPTIQPEKHGSTSILWGDENFLSINSMRAWIMLQFMELGLTVLYSDADMVWRSNVFEILDQKARENSKTAFFIEDRPGDENRICSCFVYLHPTPQNKIFLRLWHDEIHQGATIIDDQVSFNKAVRSMEKENFNYKVLDGSKDKFPFGKQYFEAWSNEQREEAHLVHNNWIVTNWRKHFRFQDAGIWKPSGRLDTVVYSCKSASVAPAAPAQANGGQVVKTQTTQLQSNRTLVILLGTVDGHETSFKSLYHHVVDANNADLALMVDYYKSDLSWLQEKAKYIWPIPKFKNWNEALNHYFYLLKTYHKAESEAIDGVARALILQMLQQLDLVKKYEWFVVTQPDQYYECDLNLAKMDSSKLWVPTGGSWWGSRDKFLATGGENILKALGHSPSVIQNQGSLDKRTDSQDASPAIARFRRTMFTASFVTNLWSKVPVDKSKIAFIEDGIGLQYKLADEYFQAMTCRSDTRAN